MPPLRRAGLPFPVACYPAPPHQQSHPDSVLGALLPTPPPPSPLDPRFPPASLFNGPIYALSRLRIRPHLTLDTRAGWYFDSLNSSESLELDLLSGIPRPPHHRPLDGSTRTAAIGISTLVALRTSGRLDLILAPVAPKAMPHRAGQLHVVPSGMFAPPYSVAANVATELREELGLTLQPRSLYLSGVAVNLLNLRPEICTLLVIDDPGPLTPNHEFLPGLARVPVASDASLIRALHLHPGSITPPGAAALFLGTRLLRSLLKRSLITV